MALVWETNSSLFDYWRPVFNQFSKIFPIETILDFFKKNKKIRQSWTRYIETKSSRNLFGFFFAMLQRKKNWAWLPKGPHIIE